MLKTTKNEVRKVNTNVLMAEAKGTTKAKSKAKN